MEKRSPNFLTYLFGVTPRFGVTRFYGTLAHWTCFLTKLLSWPWSVHLVQESTDTDPAEVLDPHLIGSRLDAASIGS